MAIRQEQVVFGLSVLLCGGLVLISSTPSIRSSARTKHLDYAPELVPEAARALPAKSAPAPIVRDLFREPTNARPMPLLAFAEPPLASLSALAPPPSPGPRVPDWGRFLRQSAEVVDVPGLFDGDGTRETFRVTEAGASEADTLTALRDLGLVPQEDAPLAEEPNRAGLLESYKDLYDWILLDEYDYHFGSIDNPGRFRLDERPNEDIAFTEVNPSTGQPRYLGQGSVEYTRTRVTSLGFADTAVNRVELGAIEREGPITRGNINERLAFADACVAGRHAAPRGLDVARDLYTRIAEFEPGDPAPRLGLARCLEAGFDFDGAFKQYETLTEAFPKSAAVAAALASLEERFLLFDVAEARLREAVRFDRGSYQGHWALGKLLLEHDGDLAEARHELELAQRFAPDSPEAAPLRAKIRVDVATAALAAGDLVTAGAVFQSALGAEADNQDALCGLYNVALLTRAMGGEASEPELPADLGGLTGPLLFARGLWRLEAEDWQGAREDLEAAVRAMPLDPSGPLAALSRLAERTAHSEEAMDFVERALLAHPGLPWALFQRGRLLHQRDDLEGSEASLQAALASDVDFADAVVLLGEIAMEEERFADAERYFQRARRLEPARVEVELRRGLNAILSGAVQTARGVFEEARALDDRDPIVLGGIAWCDYQDGASEEALNRLAALDDSRRAFGDEDPWRLWARTEKARLEDHLDKERWVDEFDRKSLRNDWLIEEGAGPLVGLVDEALSVAGQFGENGEVRVYRQLAAVRFVSIEADITVGSSSAARAGLFVAREQRGTGRTISALVSVSRHKDGSLQTHVIRSGKPDLGDQDVSWLDFPTDRPVRLRIERGGSDKAAVIHVFVDGTPVLEDVPMASFGRTQSNISIGFFVEGESGRRIDVRIDNVEIVRRKS
jgi:tetratricopeptide (TPR) repeat protein